MEQINQFGFYEVGKGLAALLQLRGDVLPTEAFFALHQGRGAVARLRDQSFFPLRLCLHELEQMHAALEAALSEFYTKNENGEPAIKWPAQDDPPLPDWHFSFLRTAVGSFEQVFAAELRGAATYFVPARGIFATPALIDSADEAFPADLRNFIPPKTRDEWRQAGRCLAFNLLSASGFHVARAVEGTIEKYHEIFCPDSKKSPRTWHDYISDFKNRSFQKSQLSPSQRVIAELEQMKDDFRNPLMHPRVVLNEADARMLLANGESIIICMAQEMQMAVHSRTA